MGDGEQITSAEAVAAAAAALATASGMFVTRRVFYLALGLITAVLIVLGIVVVTNRVFFYELQEQTDLLTECTTPAPTPDQGDPHECYDRSLERQREAVERINENFTELVDRTVEHVLELLRATGVLPPNVS